MPDPLLISIDGLEFTIEYKKSEPYYHELKFSNGSHSGSYGFFSLAFKFKRQDPILEEFIKKFSNHLKYAKNNRN